MHNIMLNSKDSRLLNQLEEYEIASLSNNPSQLGISALAALWDEPITYVKQYAEALNDINQGYFISYFTDQCQPGQWLVLDDKKIYAEMGLTPKQWRKIKAELIQKELLVQRRLDHSNKREYTLNDELLERLIKQHSDLSILSVIGAPISINRLHLKSIMDRKLSFKAVLLFSYIQNKLDYVPINKRQKLSKWIRLSEQTVFEDTFLGRKEIELAQNDLISSGLLEVSYSGFPRLKQCAINYEVVANITQQYLVHK